MDDCISFSGLEKSSELTRNSDEENEIQVVIKKTSKSSGLFMPLTGKEGALRLEDKYGMLQSDSEEEDKFPERKRGKVSQWKILESPSKWLDTQSDKKCQNGIISPGRKRSPRKIQPKDMSCTAIQMSSGKTASENDSKPGPSHSYNYSSEHEVDLNKKSQYESSFRFTQDGDGFCSEGFSLEDTEKPKFQTQPAAAKVAFWLSEDGFQPPVMVPASINQYLRDYQREGIKFLYNCYVHKTGAILGDDMGLGKTVQIIGLLAALLGKQGNHKDTIQAIPKFIRQMSDEMSDSPPKLATKPFLIIAPSAVMFNWLDELQTWGYFTARKFHGGDKDSCLSDLRRGKMEIIVTTYETFRDNADKLQNTEWEAVIVDEAHKIKDMKAQITQALSIINTPCRYGLTGTALQNNMNELFTILNWASPGILGSPEEFQDQFVHAIEAGQKHDATKRVLAHARKQKEKFAQIREKVMLRRTKALLKDQLPSKEDLVVMCRLTDLQISVYKTVLSHPNMILVMQAEDPCDCGRKKARASCCYKYAADGSKTWSLVLSYMHLLLKAANHCALLIPDSTMAHKVQFERAREICEHAFKDHPEFVEQTKTAAFMTLSNPSYCAKMKILQGLLTLFAAAHDKVLIFSYSTRLLDIIEHYVMSRCHTYRRIDGKTSSQKRLEIVKQFNSDPDIFLCLISTKAGGLGLNLTGANKVLIFDPNWNPSHDLQAQDRAFRIGQSRNVKVYRLISAGTIEENIYLRQIYKQQLDEVVVSNRNAKRLFQGIQGDKTNRGELFGIKNMFSLRTGNTCLTMDILQRNHRLEKGLENYDITQYIPPKALTSNLSEGDKDSADDSYSLLKGDGDSEEEEEESESEENDTFLENMFGKDRIFHKDEIAKSQVSHKAGHSKWSNSILESTDKTTNSSNMATSRESDEEEFSLIPTLYPRSEKKDSFHHGCEEQRRDFTFDDITFSKSALHTVTDSINLDSRDQSLAQPGSKCTALSLIFSDSDDDEDEEEEVPKNADKSTEKRQFTYKENVLNKLQEKVSRDSPKKKTLMKNSPIKVTKRKHEPSRQKNGGKRAANSDCHERDSVHAVFEACGVLHTHMNPQVVGSSRAEDHMTKCAMKEVFELHQNTQDPAVQCDPLPAQSGNQKPSKDKTAKKKMRDHNTTTSIKCGSTKILLGQTPPGVQRQQWADLCRFKKTDPLQLAEKLVTSTPEERLELLRTFYSSLHTKLTNELTGLLQMNADCYSSDNTKQEKSEKVSNRSSKSKPSSKREGSTVALKRMSSRDNSPVHSKQKGKRNVKKKRQLSPCWLEESTRLSQDSQESLTAISPPIQPPSSGDDDPQGFSPAPSSKGKRRPAMSPISKHKTRLRHSSRSETALRKHPRRGLWYGDSHEDEINKLPSDGLSTIQSYSKEMLGTTETVQRGEDISTLLTEMAVRESFQGHDGKQKCLTSKTRAQMISCPQNVKSNHIPRKVTVEAISDYTYSGNNRLEETQVFKKDVKSVSPQKRQNYATLLDDIFSSVGSEGLVEPDTHSTKESVVVSKKSTIVQNYSKEERGSRSVKPKTAHSISPFKMVHWDGDISSSDIPSRDDDTSDKVVSRDNEVNKEDSGALSIFDSLFKMNPLREEMEGNKRAGSVFLKNCNAKFCKESVKEDVTGRDSSDDKVVDFEYQSQSLFSEYS